MLRLVLRPEEASDWSSSLDVWRQRAVDCLVLGRYASGNVHVLEAFLLHLQSQYLSLQYSRLDLWFEMSTIIRLAFRLGYHRDPNQLPAVYVFDGEMRRRTWLNLVQIEALMSSITGFPSMIPMDYCDTQDPQICTTTTCKQI